MIQTCTLDMVDQFDNMQNDKKGENDLEYAYGFFLLLM